MLYKYREWNKSFDKDVLRDQELFFASINKFNDPFDSNIRINYEDLSRGEQYRLVFEHVKKDFPGLSYFKKKAKASFLLEKSALGDNEKLQENYEQYVKPNIEKEFGILSLAGRKDNLLMWSHYADSHKGYCVGFDKETLETFLKDQEEMLYLLPVEYQEEYPDLNPIKLNTVEYSIRPLIVKSSEWCYEEEERVIFIKGADKVLQFNQEIYSEIIIGCQMTDENKEELIEIVNSNFDDLPIYQAKLAERDFSLNFEQIQ